MKVKFTSIILLFCLVAPVIATLSFLQYQKKQVRRAVKSSIIAGLDKEELVLLKFTKEESQTSIRWEHATELEYKGQMYDVVETKIENDTTYYWCWLDNKETKLNKQLDQVLAYALGNNQHRNDSQKQLHNLYKSLYWEESSAFELSSWSIQTTPPLPAYKIIFQNFSHPPPVPPPQIV
jgi:hypothetical protein